jgi:hypothetical protein
MDALNIRREGAVAAASARFGGSVASQAARFEGNIAKYRAETFKAAFWPTIAGGALSATAGALSSYGAYKKRTVLSDMYGGGAL